MSSWNDDYLNVYPPTSRMYTLTMCISEKECVLEGPKPRIPILIPQVAD
ncbi:uncharacterized protein RAG0_13834 [Rhynchosporium agropyri]|uniref:Uncharacterized protein n=2 Tax=Rhynchosporium TaxID=38037 RepID=A0A1E1LEP3_9HELO|nr:uncharacterized protein RCO7_14470 [Rhynchosporium commune]CZT08902.1 uncharacterized protein RAG0_13834 [Rhynchosporium agropyri]